jgi:23S rRNA (guanosine2251-2'-O)-methyltransferase
VVGLQPVREAIRVHRARLIRVALDARPQRRLEALARLARDQGVARIERIPRGQLDRVSAGVAHQGAAAWAPELRLRSLTEVLASTDLLAVALDGIQDPQNFGAAIRSAVALAEAPVLWGEHSSAPLSTATGRASAGAIEHAWLCRVRSLVGALQTAVSHGVQVVGLDSHAPLQLRNVDLRRGTILVVGSEHQGLGRAIRRSCTVLARLAQPRVVDSLNAAVAAGAALYEAANQRANPNG